MREDFLFGIANKITTKPKGNVEKVCNYELQVNEVYSSFEEGVEYADSYHVILYKDGKQIGNAVCLNMDDAFDSYNFYKKEYGLIGNYDEKNITPKVN